MIVFDGREYSVAGAAVRVSTTRIGDSNSSRPPWIADTVEVGKKSAVEAHATASMPAIDRRTLLRIFVPHLDLRAPYPPTGERSAEVDDVADGEAVGDAAVVHDHQLSVGFDIDRTAFHLADR